MIDCDLGQSGACSNRKGFKQLVSDVGLGQVGIVMGLEVSRLVRNSSDWQRLLAICALTHSVTARSFARHAGRRSVQSPGWFAFSAHDPAAA